MRARPAWLRDAMRLILSDPNVSPHLGAKHAVFVQIHKPHMLSIPHGHVMTKADGLTRFLEPATRTALALVMLHKGHILHEEDHKDPPSATLMAAAMQERAIGPVLKTLRWRLAPKALIARLQSDRAPKPGGSPDVGQ